MNLRDADSGKILWQSNEDMCVFYIKLYLLESIYSIQRYSTLISYIVIVFIVIYIYINLLNSDLYYCYSNSVLYI